MNATDASTRHRICPFCEACCGLELTIVEGRVGGVRGHAGDVFSAGYICPKGVAIKDLHEDPDRLRQPLLKRDGRFVEVGWDAAFAEIERRLPPILATHDRDAVAMTIGNPAAHKVSLLLYGARLAKALGTKNLFTASTLDQMPKQLSCGLMYGGWLSIPVPDIERSDLLIVLGANPVASNGSLWTVPDFRGKAKALQARGGRIVVIDPRRTETAELADRHLFIRPGGDVFLLLGMAQVLFAENLVRLDRLAGHVAGLAELEAAVAPYPPEVVARRCGIEAAAIRELAREFAAAPRAAFHSRIGSCTQDYGTLACWLVDVIAILAGHFDTEGGLMFPRGAAFAANTLGKPGVGRGVVTGRHKSRVSGAPEVYGELPMGCLSEEIETPGTGQVRALITVGSNPVLSAPNGARLAAALEGLDFMVSLDIYLNETTRHADVILPGRSPLEDGHYDVAFPQFSCRNHARYSPPVFAAPAGQPAEWEILLRLAAIAAGRGAGVDVQALDDELFAAEVRRQTGPLADAVLGALAGRRGPERLIDYALRGGPYGDGFGARHDGLSLAKIEAAPGGIDLGPLAPRIPEVLRTPSGRIELAPPMLLADLCRVGADLAQPAPDPARGLVIVGRRQVRSNNSWMHNLPVLAKGPFRCTALVHPDDAARLGLAGGGRARISANARSIEVRIEVSDEMMPGVVSLPHGWGHDLPGTQLRVAQERPGANLNALFDENRRDPLSGNAVLSGVAVRIEALAAPCAPERLGQMACCGLALASALMLAVAAPRAAAQVNPLSALGRVVSTTMDARSKQDVAADAEIGAAASKQLLEDKAAEWAGVTVLVFQRHVVLAGAVKTDAVRKRVEELVRKDKRIRSLNNELMTGNVGSLARDTALEARINAALTAASGVSSVNMRWCATGGHVVLMGVAQSAAEATLANAKLRGIGGVKSIKSHLRVVARKK